MYLYHNIIRKRITSGELVDALIVEDYNGDGERLLLFFSSPPFVRPVRPHAYPKYIDVFNAFSLTAK